jgi:hypothetical protein
VFNRDIATVTRKLSVFVRFRAASAPLKHHVAGFIEETLRGPASEDRAAQTRFSGSWNRSGTDAIWSET